MADEQDIVKKKIESGEYYTEAMNWFHEKFTRPRTEFSYFFIICVLAIISFLVCLAAFSEEFPLSPGKNFILNRAIGPGEHMTIRSIQSEGETANDGIMRFMLSQYVAAREEYIESRLDRNFRIIKKFSGEAVYNQYLDDTSVNNPQNPVILYGKQATIRVEVHEIELLDALGKPAHDSNVTNTIVNYTTFLTYTSDNHVETAERQADISFKYRPIGVNQETGKLSEKPEMTITSYKTNPLKKTKTK